MKFINLAILVICLQSLVAAQPTNTIDKLHQKLQQQLSTANGLFAVAFKDLATGQTVFINEKQSFHAASTMKTAVLIEIMKQAKEGKFSLKDSILVKNSFSSIVDGSPFMLNEVDDSEPELYKQIGQKKTIEALAYDMIIASSNLATNLMIELVKAENIMATMKAMGANDIKVLRGVEDKKAFEKGLSNSTTAYDLLLIFERIATNKMVSRKASKQMVKILLDQRFKEIIPAQLPANVKVAHKTGSITGVQHDTGIVYLPDGRKYVLVLLSKFEGGEKMAVESMATVSKIVYDYMMQ